MESPEVWIQPALFPEFSRIFYAYEIDDFNNDDRYWEVYDDGEVMVGWYEPDAFPDFLDFAREINYDVCLFTYDSWIALEESYA